MLGCLQPRLDSYKKGAYVVRQGDYLNAIIVLVEGSLHVQKDDYWGNRTIIHAIHTGELFGESYAAPESGALLNDVVAETDSSIIVFDIKRMLTVCSSACRFHTKVVQNLFFSISEKNRNLVQKIGHMSKRSTRAKLLSYLSNEAKKSSQVLHKI